MIGKALAEGLNKAIFGEGEEPKGILAEAEAQAAPHDGAAYPLYIIYKKGLVQNVGI